ncbi:MAG: hypothetical protein FJ256_09035, partial [Phycisphaerae bacterium]|nr:hypothetical protein [Phycisphaerae bacterium]
MFAALALSLALMFASGATALGDRAAGATDAANALAKVDVFEVGGLIDSVVANGIETAIERSSTNGAQALVLQV